MLSTAPTFIARNTPAKSKQNRPHSSLNLTYLIPYPAFYVANAWNPTDTKNKHVNNYPELLEVKFHDAFMNDYDSTSYIGDLN